MATIYQSFIGEAEINCKILFKICNYYVTFSHVTMFDKNEGDPTKLGECAN